MSTVLRFLISAIAVLASSAAQMSASSLPAGRETLNYDIVYHWGIIWKHAGSATLSISAPGGNRRAVLACRTVSWADKVFKVRDTLSVTFRGSTLRPLVYRKASHEGKHTGTDIVEYSYSGGDSFAACRRLRPGRDAQLTNLQAEGQAYDMLSIFYYLRSLPFQSMKKGDSYSSTVFSGRKKERINIRFVGTEEIKLRDKSRHKAYHVTFSFTQDGQTKSSDDMDTWISVDALHTPLMMKGKLPIGEVRCYLSR